MANKRLVFIGGDVPICGGMIDKILVSPVGDIEIHLTGIEPHSRQLDSCREEITSWNSSKLDEISSEYFYRVEGQGMLVIDIMAAVGYLSFNEKRALYLSLDNNLKSGSFLLET